MAKFKVGIIGCGKIFPMHAVSVSKQLNAELTAVCDNKPEISEAAAKRYGCKAYTDYKQMVECESLDAVHICTPHYLHKEMAVYALNQGVNVLTEKPMAITYEDAVEMCHAARENNCALMVSFQNRFNPGSLLIKNTLESGELGAILSAKAMVTWNRSDEYYSHSDWKGTWDKEGGGVIIDQAIHTLDLMNWFIGSDIEEIDSRIANRAHHLIKVEDCADGVISYKNGVKASFFAINYYTYDAPVEIELHCQMGIAKLCGEKATIILQDGREWAADRNPAETFDFGEVKQYWGVSHMREITHFYNALEGGLSMRNTAAELLITQQLICGIYSSGKSGAPVHYSAK